MTKYACCKHGPEHARCCGFAHALGELCIPEVCSQRRRWRDRSHERGGPSGIDLFVGQEYTAYQLDRILCLVFCHGDDGLIALPGWARMLVWFRGLRHSEEYTLDADFGWSACIRENRLRIIPHVEGEFDPIVIHGE